MTQNYLALTWRDIEHEAIKSIGLIDGKKWIDSVKEVMEDRFFISTPCPAIWAMETRLKTHRPEILNIDKYTWVSPHPEAYCKLGYFQVWNFNVYGTPTVREVFGIENVKLALSENLSVLNL